jgi:Bacterial Ig-like domain (group 3)/FG-GAP-like repeat
MTSLAHRSPCSSVSSSFGKFCAKASLVLAIVATTVSAAFAAPAPTKTSLAISATSVPYKTPITLTATVTSGGSPVTAGIVLFCEATAIFCENNSALGVAQLTFPAATASVKLGSGPIGNHSYKAVFRANKNYGSSLSNTVTYAVTGTYQSTISLTATGTVGNYNLVGSVAGLGSLTQGPTGTISFLDTSNGNNVLGTENLVVSTLATTFVQNQPFAIGSPGDTQRSAAIASAYLNKDNNLDVVTGDFAQTISVLLGNGDGTFQPKVNYPGCTVGKVLQIVLADFNRDGNTDIALGCSDGTNGGLLILLGNGDGSFLNPVLYSTGDVASIAMGDFNSDGLLDFVVTDNSQQNVTFFLGKGDGTFTKDPTVLSTNAVTRGVVVADFNQDGKDDIAYALATTVPGSKLFDLYVALGNGDGTFQQQTTPVATQVGEFLTTGDTNADNMADVIAATITEPGGGLVGNSLFVLLGNGNGTFQAPVAYLSDIPSDPHLADVNGDGIPDIIAGGSTGALVYQGNGDGTFQPYQEPTIGGFALTYAVNAGDYNNDGNADLIGTDADSPRAAVSLSQVQQTSTASALTSVAVFPLGSGVHNVDASYSGDGIYFSSVSNSVPLTAAPVNTSLALSVSPTAANLSGLPVTLTAILSPYTVGPPNTTTNGDLVNFFNGTTPLGSGTLSNGVATLTTTTLISGSDSLTAVFPGDANYNSSTSNILPYTITDILLSSSLNPSTYLQTVVFTATLGSGKTGTVGFFDGATLIGTTNVTGPTVTFTTSSLSVGSHNITAQYNASVSPVLVQVVNKATPTVTVTTSGPSTFGGSVTITATVPSGVTGTITFTSGGLSLGSGTIVNGTVSVTTTALTPPSDIITATYSGDTNYNTATGTVTQTVGKANPTSTLTSSLNPSLPGSSVIFTDTLSSNATGSVTFTSGSTTIGTSTITGGMATVATSTLPLGSDPITATYSGDGNYNSATATLTQTVAKATPTLTVGTSGPSVFGQTVTITASVPNGPTGTITITTGGVTLGSGTITSSNGTVTITSSTLPVGSDLITATYGGDATNNSATGTVTQTVTKASPTETLTSSLNPSVFGQSVTFTATLPTNVTGTVTFTNGGTALGTSTVTNGKATFATATLSAGSDSITATYSGDSNNSSATASLTQTVNKTTPTVTVTTSGPSTFGGSVTITTTLPVGTTGTVTVTSGGTTLGSGTVNPTTGTVTITTTVLPVGNDPITSTYGGDSNNNPATGTTTQSVTKATTIVTLASSANPSTIGQSVTFTATVPSGVTGTVTFTSGATTLGTSTLANGVATVSTSSLPIGSDPIVVTYNGDGNYNSATATLTQTVGKVTPTVTVSTSGPSVFGQIVTITASVPNGPTGTITITSGGVTLGSGTITSSNGTVTITTSTLPVGSDLITATYGGDTNNNSATGTVTQTVTKASPTETLTSSLNPSVFGQSVTFTATLPTNVTGTVTFTNGGTAFGTSTVTNGKATFVTSTLPAGSDAIAANYSGDTNNGTSTASLTQTVNKATPTVTVTTSGPSTYGSPVTVTTTLPIGTTGTVTVTSGGTTLGSGTVNPTTGIVTVTTSTLPVGSDPITASYGGDSNNNPATGSTTQTVTKAAPTVTLTSSTNPSVIGQSVTFIATLPSGVTGNVTFTSGTTALGTSTLTNGSAAVSTSTLPLGSNPITATYNGDANNSTATASLTQTVNKTGPSVSLTSSVNPSNFNQSVTFTATVASAATGTITFLDGTTTLGTGAISNGTASYTTSSLTPGVHPITASYGGDSNYSSGVSTPLSQTVNKTTPTLPPPVVSTNNPTYGSPVTITETLPPGVSGPVTFSNGGAPIGTAPVVGGVATITVTNLPLGSDPITASTPGDSTNNPATSPSVTVTVVKASPTVAVTSSLNPSVFNQPVTFTATTPASATGTITFLDGATILGTGSLNNGQATLTTSALIVGSHVITVSYGGDPNNNSAISLPLTQVVNKATPVIPPPVVSSANPPVNTPVTITETVPTGVTGTVTFSNGGNPIGTAPIVGGVATITVSNLPIGVDPITATTSGDSNNNPATSAPTTVTVTPAIPVLVAPIVSSNNPPPNTPVTITEPIPSGVSGPITFYNGTTPLGTAPIVNGQATLTVPSLPVGTNPITVTAINTATSGTLTSPPTQVTVAKATVIVTLASSVNPAAPSQSITFSASVPAGATGSITFLDGTTILGVGAINASGIATFTTSTLAIGSHSITASYGGDSGNSAATSAVLTQVVGKIPTVTTIVLSAPAQLLHTGVTFTANVTAPAPNATGTVTFMDGTTVLGSAPLSANGGVVVSLTTNANAAFATTNLVTGPHQIVAVYSGDSNFAPSTSAPAANMVEDFTNTNTGAASQNMFPGGTTSYTFTLTPVGATTFLNDLTVQVDGLPPGSTYTFTPSTIKAGSGSTQVTLNVQTSSSLSAQNHLPQGESSPHNKMPIALGMLGLVGLGALRRLRNKIPRTLMVLLLALGSILPIAALSGCAGGYFTLNPTTYTLTVTGTEGAVQHAATATLVVQ